LLPKTPKPLQLIINSRLEMLRRLNLFVHY